MQVPERHIHTGQAAYASSFHFRQTSGELLLRLSVFEISQGSGMKDEGMGHISHPWWLQSSGSEAC